MNTANRVLDELYFITTTVVDMVDIFTRPKYKHIILESLVYCQQKVKNVCLGANKQPSIHDCQCPIGGRWMKPW